MPNTLTCVYCGMAYPEGTPPHGSKVLTDHIRICEKHPMRELESQLAASEKARAVAEARMAMVSQAVFEAGTEPLAWIGVQERIVAALADTAPPLAVVEATVSEGGKRSLRYGTTYCAVIEIPVDLPIGLPVTIIVIGRKP